MAGFREDTGHGSFVARLDRFEAAVIWAARQATEATGGRRSRVGAGTEMSGPRLNRSSYVLLDADRPNHRHAPERRRQPMALGFASAAKRGQHYELAMFAASKLKSVNLLVKGHIEKQFEAAVVACLQASPRLRKNLITQIGVDEVEKITRASLFGFSHRPDISLGNSGTAIEIKVVATGQAVRDVLGQALAYRMHYRFVILVLIDQTNERQIVNLCRIRESQEHSLLSQLAESMNIFTIIGPLSQSRNIVFAGQRQNRGKDSDTVGVLERTVEASGVGQGDHLEPGAQTVQPS